MTPAVAVNLEIQALRRWRERSRHLRWPPSRWPGSCRTNPARHGRDHSAVIWLSDLRGFTSLSESSPRDELIEMLNRYFGPMCDAVEASGGEVLKFIGDAMLAIFPDRAGRGCRLSSRARRRGRRGPPSNKENHGAPLPEAENPLWPGVARRRCDVRQHRRGRAARFHGDRTRGQSHLAHRIDVQRPLSFALALSGIRAPSGVEAEHLGEFALKGVVEKQLIYGLRE